jgi:hypothetical protein
MMAKKENVHFSAEDWVDFTMQQASPERLEAMKQHLVSGCDKCIRLEHLWNRIAQVARRDSGHEPPASAVQHVRGAFALMVEAEGSKRARVIPRLVFDSLWQPALAGVRSALNSARQVIYHASDIRIEMRVEPEPMSERVHVAGQISNTAKQGEGIAEMPVIVSSDGRTLTSALTNRFGEFHATFVPEAGLRISFGAVNDKELWIPLDGTGFRQLSRE